MLFDVLFNVSFVISLLVNIFLFIQFCKTYDYDELKRKLESSRNSTDIHYAKFRSLHNDLHHLLERYKIIN
jgi:hypothetical protein